MPESHSLTRAPSLALVRERRMRARIYICDRGTITGSILTRRRPCSMSSTPCPIQARATARASVQFPLGWSETAATVHRRSSVNRHRTTRHITDVGICAPFLAELRPISTDFRRVWRWTRKVMAFCYCANSYLRARSRSCAPRRLRVLSSIQPTASMTAGSGRMRCGAVDSAQMKLADDTVHVEPDVVARFGQPP